jgi:hypothetical protein
MERRMENKIVLVTRRSRLEDLVARYNTVNQAKFYIEHLGADFSDYVREHDTYHACMRVAESALRHFGRVQMVERGFLPNFLFGPDDIVVALGQDGLVANTMKYLDGHPDGVLLPFQVQDLAKLMPDVLARRRAMQAVTMARARLNNGQELYGVNDIFIGPKSHTSARYTIRLGEREERQSSSGIIVSTGLGSTGWLKSLQVGAAAIAAGGGDWQTRERATPWDADYLHFTVREPFPSKASAASLVAGRIGARVSLTLVSAMAENGVIFSDGIEADYLEFNAGITVDVGIAEKRGYLVT